MKGEQRSRAGNETARRLSRTEEATQRLGGLEERGRVNVVAGIDWNIREGFLEGGEKIGRHDGCMRTKGRKRR